MTAPSRGYSVHGWTPSDPGKPTSLARAKRLGVSMAGPVRFGGSASGVTLLAGEGIETVLSLVTAVPGIQAGRSSISGPSRRLRTTPRPLPVGHRPG